MTPFFAETKRTNMKNVTLPYALPHSVQGKLPLAHSPLNISFQQKKWITLREQIRNQFGPSVLRFIELQVDLGNPKNLILATATRFNILSQEVPQFQNIVNLKRINDIRYINKFFEAVNTKMDFSGHFIGCVETKNLRKERVLKKFPAGMNYLIYTLDFILKRIFPKLPITKKIYFFLTRGNNRVISKAETLGRLVSCGFSIIDEKVIDGHLFFVAQKIKKPLYPQNPTYSLLIKLNRIGQEGKKIQVYKLRSMHPFSEYLQEYIYQKNKMEAGGKFKNDFRVSFIGRILRKFWIDELPMLFNLLRGDLKLVGVRPLSPHYFNLYDNHLKQLRIQTKPGLIPPFYADMPRTFNDIRESERRYLLKHRKAPLKTDFVYFRKALFNIFFKNARSR